MSPYLQISSLSSSQVTVGGRWGSFGLIQCNKTYAKGSGKKVNPQITY